MREDAARPLWADDYESLRERARAHLGAESATRPVGVSRNVRVVSSRSMAEHHVVTAPQGPEGRRFARAEPVRDRSGHAEPVRERSARAEPARDFAGHERVPAPRSYGSRRGQAEVRVEPAPPRRTVTITGQPTRRRSPALTRVAAEPDRMALWAVMLGVFLVLVALASAHV